jgi:hypothetical protein
MPGRMIPGGEKAEGHLKTGNRKIMVVEDEHIRNNNGSMPDR